MVEESDVVGFLKDKQGQASLNEIAQGLAVPKYGPNSAYALLQALRNKGIVDRRGEMWILLTSDTAISKEPLDEKEAEEVAATDVENLMKSMAKTFAEAVKEAQVPAYELKLTTEPMIAEVERKEEKLRNLVLRPDPPAEAKKPLIGLATGTLLDYLFITPEGKPLMGLPIVGQFAITGLPGSGKSILVEEIAIRAAATDRKVLFATAEETWKSGTSRFDLQSRLKQKVDILRLDWKKIMENLLVLDAVAFPELRDWNTFTEAYRYVIENEKIELTIIDSVTVLESSLGALNYRVMELARYNQLHGVTCLYVNQLNSEMQNSHERVGSIELAYGLDSKILIDCERIYWQDKQMDLEAKRDEFMRIVRVLDCRLCNYERRPIHIDITPDGFVKPLEPIPKSLELR